MDTAGPTSGADALYFAFAPVKTRFFSVSVASGSEAWSRPMVRLPPE